MESNDNYIVQSILDLLSGNLCSNNEELYDDIDEINQYKSILTKTIVLLDSKHSSNFILGNDQLFKLVNNINDLSKSLIDLKN